MCILLLLLLEFKNIDRATYQLLIVSPYKSSGFWMKLKKYKAISNKITRGNART